MLKPPAYRATRHANDQWEVIGAGGPITVVFLPPLESINRPPNTWEVVVETADRRVAASGAGVSKETAYGDFLRHGVAAAPHINWKDVAKALKVAGAF